MSRRKGDCVVCYLGLDKDGYSRIQFGDRTIRTSRVIMHLVKDFDINSPLLILHDDSFCKSRACIEINHLRPGTSQENQGDRITKHGNSRKDYFKQICIRGHKRKRKGIRCSECAREDYIKKREQNV